MKRVLEKKGVLTMKRDYSKKEMKHILKKEMELSNVVNQKIEDAFEQIKPNYQRSKENDKIIPYRKKIHWKTSVVAIGVLILVCAGVTGVAYSIENWHPIMMWLFQANEQTQEKMDQIGLSDKPEANIASFDNINVEMVQSIADNRFLYLLLKVTATDETTFPFEEMDLSGIPEEKRKTRDVIYEVSPSIAEATMVLNESGETIFIDVPKIYPAEDEHSFYCELLGRQSDEITNINEQMVTLALKDIFPEGDKVGNWESQVSQQACMEAGGSIHRDDIDWEAWSKKIPKPEENKREGEWKLTWKMKATDKQIHIKNKELPQYGTVMTDISISPISLLMEYDWSIFEKYGVTEYQYFGEPFLPTHFKMKDGTIIESGFNLGGGFSGYEDEALTKYHLFGRLDTVIDVDNIQSVILTYIEDQSQVEIPVE